MIHRIRFQLPLGLLFAVGVPYLVRGVPAPHFYFTSGTINSVVMCSVAVVAAYFGWRRLHQFPGVKLAASAVWSVALAFGLVWLATLAMRLDYSRSILIGSPLLIVSWLMFLAWASTRLERMAIGIIPGGRVNELPQSENIEWIEIKSLELSYEVDAYVIDLRHHHVPSWEAFVADRTLEGIPVYHYKQVSEHLTGQVSIDSLSENSFGSVLPSLSYLSVKRLIDVISVIIFAPIIFPFMLFIWFLIAIVDGRPSLFLQKRVGHKGNIFTIYKFRTMNEIQLQNDTQHSDGVLHDEERITKLGRFLRRTRIDELPQVINIALGSMSWIGPRPEAVLLSERYERLFPFYRYRHAVRPGISGWAQVNQGHTIEDNEVKEKLKYDFFYVKNVSAWLDLVIAIKTIRIVFFGHGAR